MVLARAARERAVEKCMVDKRVTGPSFELMDLCELAGE